MQVSLVYINNVMGGRKKSGEASEKKKRRGRKDEDASLFGKLPNEVVALVLNTLSLDEKLQVAPLVCKRWLQISREEALFWHTLDFRDWDAYSPHLFRSLLHRSRPTLHTVMTNTFGCSHLRLIGLDGGDSLEYLSIADNDRMSDKCAYQIAPMLKVLKRLDISYCHSLTHKGIQAFGNHCKMLRHLHVTPTQSYDCQVIASTMPQLKQLEVVELEGILLEKGMLLILYQCKKLEILDFYKEKYNDQNKELHFHINLPKAAQERVTLLDQIFSEEYLKEVFADLEVDRSAYPCIERLQSSVI